MSETLDVLIVGAGPAGLHAACIAEDVGLAYRVIDRAGLAHSFVEYPQAMRFFSPPSEMEVGGMPFPMRGGDKPSREDILPYFRSVAAYRRLKLRICTRTRSPESAKTHHARTIALATGVWDQPNRLNCAGDDLPHVFHRFHEPTEYFGQSVLVTGGGNSAVHAALTLSEAHAQVVLAMRRPPAAFQSHLRPFVVRDLEFAVD